MRRLVLLLFLAAAITISFASAGGPTTVRAQTSCGVERWPVKTLSDNDVSQVDFADAVPETVADLVQYTPPGVFPQRNRVAPVEDTVFTVTAYAVEAKVEPDSDIHLILADPNTGDTMIAELPDADNCALTTDPSLVAAMDSARNTFLAAYGLPSSYGFTPLSGVVQVTGVGFWDNEHGQRGVAPNGIELHPVLDLQVYPNSFTSSPSESAAPAPMSAPVPAPVAVDSNAGHTFYASGYYTASTIYCDDDSTWRRLSPRYLLHFNSLEEAFAALPGYHLHRPC